ncbi:MAG: ATP-binding protein [Propionibacteriaceae bacterium]|nr:ATP-binding protein [Propionibacteriaceae bacterium]
MEDGLARHSEAEAREILDFMPGLVIEGARQVGKSTLARRLAATGEAVIVNLDEPQTRAAAAEDLVGFVAQAGPRLMVIDEAQQLPEITVAVKTAIDRDRRPGRFVLTGSSSLLRVRGLADSLAGRVGRLQLYGFSQGELAGSRDDFATAVTAAPSDRLIAQTSDLDRRDYARLVAQGAYPPVREVSERRRQRWLDDYLQGLLRRDLPELRRFFSSDRAGSLLRLLAANQAGEVVKARLAQESEVPAATISAYLDLLADVWLFAAVPTWTPNLSQREVARPKGLILDSGLATRLCRLTASHLASLDHGAAFGALLEGFVAAELLRQRTWSATSFDLFHYRDRAGAEVDLILELDGGQVIAVEVKAATSFQAAHFKSLKVLRDKLGRRLTAGIVLNTGAAGYRFSDRLYGLPISALWRLGADPTGRDPAAD